MINNKKTLTKQAIVKLEMINSKNIINQKLLLKHTAK